MFLKGSELKNGVTILLKYLTFPLKKFGLSSVKPSYTIDGHFFKLSLMKITLENKKNQSIEYLENYLDYSLNIQSEFSKGKCRISFEILPK